MFKNRTTLFFLIGSLLQAFAFLPSNYLLPQLFQGVRGASPLGSGLQLLPYAIGVAWTTVVGTSTLNLIMSSPLLSRPDKLPTPYNPPSSMGRLRNRRSLLRPLLRRVHLPFLPSQARRSPTPRRVRDRFITPDTDAHPSSGYATEGDGCCDQCLDSDEVDRG